MRRTRRRPQSPLARSGPGSARAACSSALGRAGVRGGGLSKISALHFGCSTARNKGETACGNQRVIRRDVLEQRSMRTLRMIDGGDRIYADPLDVSPLPAPRSDSGRSSGAALSRSKSGSRSFFPARLRSLPARLAA